MSWNLVPLCLRDHALVERMVHVDAAGDQLTLLDEPMFPWLAARLRDRARFPYRPEALGAAETAAAASHISSSAADPSPAPSERLCACGCGQRIPPDSRGLPRRYVDRAHQQRAYRERRAAQTSLLAALVDADA